MKYSQLTYLYMYLIIVIVSVKHVLKFTWNLLSVHIFVHDLENKLFLLNQDAEYKLFSSIIRKIILVLF